MNKKVDNDWQKFLNPKEIKKNLIDASLFLSFYEMLNNTIVDRISSFYNMDYRDGKFITSQKYKEVIINRLHSGKTNIFLSSCRWIVENEVISSDEFELILRIKEHRNRIAHDLTKFLFDSEYTIDENLFESIKILTLKIERWWILEVEIPTNPDLDGQEIDPDKVIPGQEFILDYIFRIANTDIEELERTINDIEIKIKK